LTTTPEADAGEKRAQPVDLRTASLSSIRGRDLRAPDRDLWADEAALWDRMQRAWTGLDDASWHLPGAAPSDAGGPPWSLAEHVGHIADWQELAIDYTRRAIETGQWPSDTDYDDGDFDTYNERRREPWASMPRDEILARLEAARPRLIEVARRLSLETIRGDDAWDWVYTTLHGHYLDHLVVIEPWTAELRRLGAAR
jgi:DinB superfamily